MIRSRRALGDQEDVAEHGGVDRCAALEAFDRCGDAVFASLCRVALADRTVAVDALLQTFTTAAAAAADRTMTSGVGGPPPPATLELLLLTGHRIVLSASHDGGETAATSDVTLGDVTVGISPLGVLTTPERVAINLHDIDRLHPQLVADLLGIDVARLRSILGGARRAVALAATTEADVGAGVVGRAASEPATIVDAFRRAELWLGDDERDDVRVALGATSARPGAATSSDVAGEHVAFDRTSTPRRGAYALLAAAAAIGAAISIAVRLGDGNGNNTETPSPAPVGPTAPGAPGAATPAVTRASETVNGVTVSVDVSSIAAATSAPNVVFLASGLTKSAVIEPELVVRYPDGSIGISWHGPCNRPALAVSLTNTARGAVIELTTAEFPVVSCTGMPDRWSAVIATTAPVAEGSIVPLTPAHTIDTAFAGYVEAPSASSKPDRDATAHEVAVPAASSPDATAGAGDPALGFGSALVDGADQPWIYGRGCAAQVSARPSSVGPLFEVRRTESLDPDEYSSSDVMVCGELARRRVLTGPLGATLPHLRPADATDSAPVDCRGPAGSATDVSSRPPDGSDPVGSNPPGAGWSTWDGCRIRSDVIATTTTFPECPRRDVRTITFAAETLGRVMTNGAARSTFVRDPDHVVDGTRPPLLHYVIAPAELFDSGLRFGDQELWLSAESPDAIYLTSGSDVERWPRLTTEVTCS